MKQEQTKHGTRISGLSLERGRPRPLPRTAAVRDKPAPSTSEGFGDEAAGTGPGPEAPRRCRFKGGRGSRSSSARPGPAPAQRGGAGRRRRPGAGTVIHHYEEQHPVSLFQAFCLITSFRQNTFAKAWRSRRGGLPLCWKRCCHWSAGKSLDPEVRAFLEENTEVTSSGHLTPEIRLRLLTPRCRFWREKSDLWPYGDPFWAIYWPGGQALSRYILDNPRVVKGRSVLDLGSGCGATAIAAVMSGASQVLANDIDPIAGVAMILNCELNHLNPFPITIKNIINSEAGNWDLIVLGDMFYDEQLADGLHHWLRKCIRIQQTEVLIGDPGRHQFLSHSIRNQLHKVIEYSLPEYTRQENNGLTSSIVWSYQPSNSLENC